MAEIAFFGDGRSAIAIHALIAFAVIDKVITAFAHTPLTRFARKVGVTSILIVFIFRCAFDVDFALAARRGFAINAVHAFAVFANTGADFVGFDITIVAIQPRFVVIFALRAIALGIALIPHACAIFTDFVGQTCRFGEQAIGLAGFDRFAIGRACLGIRHSAFGLELAFSFLAGIVLDFAIIIGRAVVGAFAFDAFEPIGTGVLFEFAFGIAHFLYGLGTADLGVLRRIAFGALALIANIIAGTRRFFVRPSGIAHFCGFVAGAYRFLIVGIASHTGTAQTDGVFVCTGGPDNFRIFTFGEFARRSTAGHEGFFGAGIAFLSVFLADTAIAMLTLFAGFLFDFAVLADRMRCLALAFGSKGRFDAGLIGACPRNAGLGATRHFRHDAIRANQEFIGVKALILESIHHTGIADVDIVKAFAVAAVFSFAAVVFGHIAMLADQLDIIFA